MPLATGQTLSFYEIVGPLGAGGMGEVYRARDTRLEREVAIKVLPEELADDDERLRRFEREAKTLASLNHPNVAGIHGIDQVDDTCFIAMELVPGEDLATRLEAGPLPVDEAIDVCRQIAEGLEAAHEAAVVHRDLKPANVRITPEGVVKILDFGLAKPMQLHTRRDGTSTAQSDSFLVTEEGMMLGTPTYMSPEQARGKLVDRRTDIWAFGCVLYECLTGKRAFAGDAFGDLIAAILEHEVDFSALPASTPPHVRRLLERTLTKDPRTRLRDIGEARVALEGAPPESVPAAERPRSGAAIPALGGAALGGVLGVVLGGALVFFLVGGGALAPADDVASDPPVVRTLSFSGDDATPSASPDGRLIAFRSGRDGRDRIWLKQLDTGGEQVLTDGLDASPRFAPDGSSILFLRSEGDRLSVYRQALVGGEARKLVDGATEACWSPDGTEIGVLRVLGEGEHHEVALSIVDVRTREERELLRTVEWLFSLRWSPDGRELSMAAAPQLGQTVDQSALLTIAAEGGEPTRYPLVGPLMHAHDWVGGGRRVVYSQSQSSTGELGDSISRVVLWDLDQGERRTLFHAEYLFTSLGTNATSRGAGLTVVADGTLAFDAVSLRQLLWEQEIVDGRAVRPGRKLLSGEARDRQPAYSPDGSRVRFASNRSGNLDLWEIELANGRARQLTDDRAQDWDPEFAHDGEGLLWSSDRSGSFEVWTANADGTNPRQLSQDGIDAENPVTAPGGEWIVYWSGNAEKAGMWRMRRDGSSAERIAVGDYVQSAISDDGRWASFLFPEPHNLRSRLRVVEIESGRIVPFEISIPNGTQLSETILLGRMRWVENCALSQTPALAFIAMDDEGRTGVFLQDFDPERDTTASRRPLAGFHDDLITESFSIAPDGSRITLALLEIRRKLMLAEGVEGIVAPVAGGS